jgi:branched-chain amino acid transport system permease protein
MMRPSQAERRAPDPGHADPRPIWRIARERRLDIVAIGVLVLLLALPVIAHAVGQPWLMTLMGRALVFAVAALALDLVLGVGGLVSFGHAAFLGIGGYATGIAITHGLDEGLLVLPLVMGAGAVFAFVTGALAVRTRGVAFIMITLAFAQMAFFLAQSLSAYGGDDGLTIYGRLQIAGIDLVKGETAFYLAALAVLVAAFVVARHVTRSPAGRALAAARDNPQRLASLGYDVARLQVRFYTLSGALSALAGCLLATQTEFVSPAYMSWQRSGELIAMVVLGGMGTLIGPVVGALALILAEDLLTHVTQHWKAILGPLVVLVALHARGGLVGLMMRRPGDGGGS